MHRFRCDELEGLKPGASVRLEKSENAHLFKTLRAAEGERCLLMDGRGNIGEAEVAAGRTLILRSRESAAPPGTSGGSSVYRSAAPSEDGSDSQAVHRTGRPPDRSRDLRTFRFASRQRFHQRALDGADVRSLQTVRQCVCAGDLREHSFSRCGKRFQETLAAPASSGLFPDAPNRRCREHAATLRGLSGRRAVSRKPRRN